MSGRVFLVPAAPGKYDCTVASTVAPSTHLDAPESLPDHGVRLWGARADDRNERLFEAMSPDDLLLFAQGERYVGIGRVGQTFVDDDGWVSRTFWNGAPASLIYTVDDFDRIDVAAEEVNDLFEYDADHEPRGLTQVDADRVTMPLSEIRAATLDASERTVETPD